MVTDNTRNAHGMNFEDDVPLYLGSDNNVLIDYESGLGRLRFRDVGASLNVFDIRLGGSPGTAYIEKNVELQGNTLTDLSKVGLNPQSSAPPASNGDIAYADGTGWDPGSGAGFYGYEEGAWTKL